MFIMTVMFIMIKVGKFVPSQALSSQVSHGTISQMLIIMAIFCLFLEDIV
jgi:hypothetical protein